MIASMFSVGKVKDKVKGTGDSLSLVPDPSSSSVCTRYESFTQWYRTYLISTSQYLCRTRRRERGGVETGGEEGKKHNKTFHLVCQR